MSHEVVLAALLNSKEEAIAKKKQNQQKIFPKIWVWRHPNTRIGSEPKGGLLDH